MKNTFFNRYKQKRTNIKNSKHTMCLLDTTTPLSIQMISLAADGVTWNCTTTLNFSIRTFSLTEEWAVVGAIIARQRQDLFCQICRHDVLVGNFWKFGHADTCYKVFVLASQQAGAEWLTSQLTASHTVCSAFHSTIRHPYLGSGYCSQFLRKKVSFW